MWEAILYTLLALGLFGGLVYLRYREQRYLKKPTREAMSQKLRKEIEKERAENIRKKEKFEETLKKLGGS